MSRKSINSIFFIIVLFLDIMFGQYHILCDVLHVEYTIIYKPSFTGDIRTISVR